MKKIAYIFLLFFMPVPLLNAQQLTIPDSYSIVDSVSGDLDEDAIKELVLAYNMAPENGIEGVTRELIIYKLQNNKWIEWKKSDQALYASRDGGMMGDPYGKMEIKNGVLHISHNGGSSWNWGVTDKYRLQDGEFYLIGYTHASGKPCEYFRDVDFNLLTGKMIVKKEFEECETDEQKIYKRENEILFEKGLKITIQKREERQIKIITPKFGHEIYIAVGKE